MLCDKSKKSTKDESSTTAFDWRMQAVTKLRSNKDFHAAIWKEIKEACQIHHSAKPGSDVGDPTTKSIWNEMKKRFSDPLAPNNIQSEAALDIYGSIMSQDGIYGTALELEALAHLVQTPVHVYYRSGSSGSNDKITGPSRIVGEQFIRSDQPTLPVSVAFYMANKHYNLVVPKAPNFANDKKSNDLGESKLQQREGVENGSGRDSKENEGEQKNQNQREGEEKEKEDRSEESRSNSSSSSNSISNSSSGSNSSGSSSSNSIISSSSSNSSNDISGGTSESNPSKPDMLKLTLLIEGSIAKPPFQIHLPRTCLLVQLYEGIGKQRKVVSSSGPSEFQLFLKREKGGTELETEFGTSSNQGIALPKSTKELTLKEGDVLVLVLKEEWVKIDKTDLA